MCNVTVRIFYLLKFAAILTIYREANPSKPGCVVSKLDSCVILPELVVVMFGGYAEYESSATEHVPAR